MADSSSRQKSVLLVEDTLDQALLLRTLLETVLGAKVTLAQDGVRGCQLAENEVWDLVITDLNLPGRDGMEVIQVSKEFHPDTPVVATTAYTGSHYVDASYRAGADAVLEKPLDRDELMGQLARLGLSGEAEEETPEPAAPAGGTEAPAPSETAEPESADPSETILAVGALPGDIELGCGGTLLRHVERGHRIVLLHLTAGEEGKKSSRKIDAQQAAQVLGAHMIIGESFAEAVPTPKEMMALVQRTVEDFEPTTVYAPSASDVRESRQNTNRAANLAASDVNNFYCYQAPTTTLDFHPTLFVDISDYMGEKMQALSHYGSQIESRPHLAPDFVQSTARYWGRFLGYGRVEPLEVVRGRGG